jgi:F-type H+-transporting ATPase subunit delta
MSKLDGKISRRYVKALLESCGAERLEEISGALGQVAALWSGSKEMRDVLSAPAIPEAEKEAVVRDVAEGVLAGNTLFSNFLVLLQQNRRLANANDIHEALESYIRELKKQLSLVVTSAHEVPESERESISSQVQNEYGSLATIAWQVDAELIGGLRIQAGDRLLDNSVQTSLNRLRSSLLI